MSYLNIHPKDYVYLVLNTIGISAIHHSGNLSTDQKYQVFRALSILDSSLDSLDPTSKEVYATCILEMNRRGGGLGTQQKRALANWCSAAYELKTNPSLVSQIAYDYAFGSLVSASFTSTIRRDLGYLLNDIIVNLSPIPVNGLISRMDGSVPTSFFSDIAKTTQSTDGGPVAIWADVSGNGNDWSQPNPSYQPIADIANNRLHNNVSGSSTATSKHLIGPDMSALTEASFFARVRNISNATSNGGIWGTTSWTSQNAMNHWYAFMTFGATVRGVAALPGYSEVTLEENVSAGAIQKRYLAGVETNSSSAGTVGFRPNPYLGCGVRQGNPQFSGNFYFYKFASYNRVVTPEERILINTWLES